MSFTYENLPVAVNKKGDDIYEVGVVLHGKLFVFGGFKAGGFEEDLREAQAEEQQRSSSPEPVV